MQETFTKEVWQYPGMSGWHFISVPKPFAEKIRIKCGKLKRGWGSFKIEAKIGKTIWETSIFPDKKSGTYILPLKASVRKKEGIYMGDKITLTMKLKS